MEHRRDLTFNGEKLSGYRCSCGEEYYDPEAAQRVLLRQKLAHAKLTAKLGRIRSNLILRLPKDVEKALGLAEGEEVQLTVERGVLKVAKA